MCCACHLIVLNVCVKFHENVSSGFKLTERTFSSLKEHTDVVIIMLRIIYISLLFTF